MVIIQVRAKRAPLQTKEQQIKDLITLGNALFLSPHGIPFYF